MEALYPQLLAIAAGRLPHGAAGFTLDTREVVHEAYLKILGQETPWANRAHFLAVSARVMRRVVLDHLRRRGREKRGGGAPHLPLDEVAVPVAPESVDWLALDQALNELEEVDGKAARVVELRFFSGMTLAETATALEVSSSTVERSWRFARAWLENRLTGDGPEKP